MLPLIRYLESAPLSARLAAFAALTQALQQLHQREQLHRHLTSEAILITNNRVTLADAKEAGLPPLGYLAPESARPNPPDATEATDLFSLGVILYECLTQQRPFRGDNPLQVRLKTLECRPAPPKEISDCPEALSDLCLSLLSKEPAARPGLEVVLAEVAPFAGELPPSSQIDDAASLPGPTPTPAPVAVTAPISLLVEAPPPKEEATISASPAINGRYRVEGELGRGGIGKVSRVLDTHLKRPVALKELLRDQGDARERFLREAHLTARLQHPGIVPLYEASTRPDGAPFYTMKMVSGEPLSEAIQRRKTLPERLSLLPRLLAACETMAYAHDQKIIHRDLKPQNILLGEYGETIIIDWGLAKETGNTSTSSARSGEGGTGNGEQGLPRAGEAVYRESAEPLLTQTGAILGTPAFMPPEQARGESVDARADVYALGAVLYSLLSGHPPYRGRDALAQVTSGPPAPLSSEAPRALVAIVEKAMARQASERYANAKTLAEDLQKFQTGQLVGAHQYSFRERVALFLRRNRAAVSVAALSLMILALTASIGLYQIIQQERLAIERADALALVSARSMLGSDPAGALRVLSNLSDRFEQWGAARILAADALSRGEPTVLTGYHRDRRRDITAIETTTSGLIAYPIASGHILWDGAQHPLSGPNKPLQRVAFSPDEKTLAGLGDDKKLYLWDVDCARRDACVPTSVFDSDGMTLAFSPDGVYLAFSNQNEVQLLHRPSQTISHHAAHTANVIEFAFSPDAKTLISAGVDGVIYRWDLQTKTGQQILQGLLRTWEIEFSRDGRLVMTSSVDSTIRFWDTSTWQEALPALSFVGVWGNLQMISSRDGTLLFCIGADEKITIFNLATRERSTLKEHAGQINAAALSPDGRLLATGASDASVSVYDIYTGRSQTFPGHLGSVGWVGFLDSGRLVSASADDMLRVFSIKSGERFLLSDAEATPIHNTELNQHPMDFSPSGDRLAYAASDHRVALLDVASQKSTTLFQAKGDILAVSFSSDAQWLAAAGKEGTIYLWSFKKKELSTLNGHKERVEALDFSPDAARLATGDLSGEIYLWDLSTKEGTLLSSHKREIFRLRFSHDATRLASCGREPFALVWDLSTREHISLSGSGGAIWDVVFSLDDQRLFGAAANSNVYVWDLTTKAATSSLKHANRVRRVTLSPDGELLASASIDGTIRLWDAATLTPLRVLRRHIRGVRDVNFSSDGGRLLSGGEDGMVVLWDVASGEGRTLLGHEGTVYQTMFSPDGKSAASFSLDGTVRIWDDSLPFGASALRSLFNSLTSRR